MLLLFATSTATAPATFSATAPSAFGVTSTVYVEPEPANALNVALLATMSETSKPVTSSLKVMVAVKAELMKPDAPVMATVGTEPSKSADSWVAAVLLLPAKSTAAALATSSVTAPSAVGVTRTV